MPGDPDDDAPGTSWAPFGSYTADDDLPPLPDEPPPLADPAPVADAPPPPLTDALPAADAPPADSPAAADAPPEVPSWEDFLPHRPAVEEDEPWRPPAAPVEEEDEPWRPPAETVEDDEPWRPSAAPAEADERPPAAAGADAPAPAQKAFFNWTAPPAPRAELPAKAGYVPGRDDEAPARKRPAKKGSSGGVALFLAVVAWLFVGPVAAVAAIFFGVAALVNPRAPRDRQLAGVAIAIAVLNVLADVAGTATRGL